MDMKVEKEILQNLETILKTVVTNKDVEVAQAQDYEDQRDKYMVVVKCDNVTNINPDLKDYRFSIRIIIDFFIEDDPKAQLFNDTRDEIYQYIEERFLTTRLNLGQIQEGIVYCGLDDVDNTTTDDSHRCEITLELIGSWD